MISNRLPSGQPFRGVAARAIIERIAGGRSLWLLAALALLVPAALAGLLWLPSADPAQAQAETGSPTITAGPTITSSPASGDTYGKGEAIVVAVTFSEAVTVSGQPRVRLDIGEQKRWARYDRSEADGTRLLFATPLRTTTGMTTASASRKTPWD